MTPPAHYIVYWVFVWSIELDLPHLISPIEVSAPLPAAFAV